MSRWRASSSVRWIVGPCLAALIGGPLVSPARADGPNPWAKKAQWFSLRAGYAKSGAEASADGNFGFGFGYTRFRNEKWAYGAHAQFDILGRYGDAREIEVPWTVEITRHYQWNTPLRPYLGIGAGAYYHQITGTGADLAAVLPGGYLVGGANAPISARALLGVDVRMSMVRAFANDNPVFGGKATLGENQKRVIHWSVKLNYARLF